MIVPRPSERRQLMNHFNGNFVQAEMVKAFLDSTEYRHDSALLRNQGT